MSFVHLSCAALFGVDSELAWAVYSNSLPEQGVEPGWQILVLKPDGREDFKKRVARVQRRLTPLHRRIVGGCHLDRPIADLVRGAGFRLTRLENYYFHRPRAVGYTYEGVATKK